MSAPRKYPGQMREQAIRLVPDVADEAGNVTAACRRIGEELGINAGTLRGRVKQAQIDAGKRPGTTSGDAARIRQLAGCCRIGGFAACRGAPGVGA